MINSCTVPNALLKKLMRVDVDDIVRCINDLHLGSQLAGVVGLNLHTSNALAALYLALGQDVACVAENCVGIGTYEKIGGDLFVTLSMPSITVGTVGGHPADNNTATSSCSAAPGKTVPANSRKLSAPPR